MSELHPPHPTADGVATEPDASGVTVVPSPLTPLRWDSHKLLQGHRQVKIRHGETFYRLRQTAAGKLILTK